MTGQKDATRHDCTGGPRGVFDRGGNKLAVFHLCCSDDEVIQLIRCDAICRENAGENACTIAIDRPVRCGLSDRRTVPAAGRLRIWVRVPKLLPFPLPGRG